MITVGVVEDLEEVREGLISFIRADNELDLLFSAAGGEEAITLLPAFQPDVVIMDISLPDISGIECIRRVKHDCRNTQFMMFTVYENDDKVFHALQAGASGYLLKSADPALILESLKELHRGGSPMSPVIARKLVNIFRDQQTPSNETQSLTKRENDILQLLARGLLYKEISSELAISIGTVRQHIHHIYEKLHVQNRTEALNKVRQNR